MKVQLRELSNDVAGVAVEGFPETCSDDVVPLEHLGHGSPASLHSSDTTQSSSVSVLEQYHAIGAPVQSQEEMSTHFEAEMRALAERDEKAQAEIDAEMQKRQVEFEAEMRAMQEADEEAQAEFDAEMQKRQVEFDAEMRDMDEKAQSELERAILRMQAVLAILIVAIIVVLLALYILRVTNIRT
jgi:DNA anti-recombination protein RmuC